MTTREILRRLAVHLAITTIAVAQPLLGLYGENLAVFTTAKLGGSSILWFGVLIVVVPAVVVWGLDVAVSTLWPAKSQTVHLLAVFVAVVGAVALLLRPVSLGAWSLDLIMIGVGSTLTVAAYARWRPMKVWIGWTSPLSVVVLLGFVVSVAPLVWPPEPGRAASGKGSAVDVVWIVLDEAPLYPLVGSDGDVNRDRFPGFASLAATSTWYRNAVSSSSRTIVSLASMLTGMRPDYGRQPILADHPDNIFTLVSGAMNLDVLEEATSLCAGSWCEPPDQTGANSRRATRAASVPFTSFLRDAAVVLGHTLLPKGLRATLPPIDEGWGGFGRASVTLPPTDGEDDEQIGTMPDNRARLELLESLGARVASGSGPTLGFAHVLLPHRPWVLAPDQRMSAPPIPDIRKSTSVDRRRDAYQSLLNQYIAVDAQVGRLVDALKASPRWDKTMVVVTADHGITFVPGVGHRKTDPAIPGTFDDLFRVPMFVRFPGQDSASVNDCAALSLDIVPTVASAIGFEPTWSTDGVDLAETCPERPSRDVSWLEGKATVTTGVEAVAARVDWYGEWVSPDGSADDIYRIGPYGALVGTKAPDDAPVDDAIEWYLNNADAFADVSGERFGAVPTRAVGRMTARREIAADEEVLVAVDGVFVGVVREAADLVLGRRSYFSASLMSRLIGAGSHEVSLWIASGGEETPSLARLAPSSK